MKLRLFAYLCLALASFPLAQTTEAQQVTTSSSTRKQRLDPSDQYLQGWYLIRDAEKFAQQQKYAEAVRAARKADKIFAAISEANPQWKTNMVAARRQKTSEDIEKWKKEARRIASAPQDNSIEKGSTIPGPNSETPQQKPSPKPVDTPKNPAQPVAPSALPTFDDLQKARDNGLRNNVAPTPPPVTIISSPETAGSSYDRMEKEILRLQMENKALVKALQDTRYSLEQAYARRSSAEAGEATYKRMLEELQQKVEAERKTSNDLVLSLTKRVNEAEEQLKLAQQERAQSEELIANLQQRLEESESLLEETARERDDLKKQRDELAAIIELNNAEKTKGLMDRNMTLAAQLKQAQERIAELEKSNQESEDMRAANLRELERTRAEASQIKIALAALRDENLGYRRRISELNTKLVNTEAELDKLSEAPKEDPITVEENRLLRSTVSKQMRLLSTQVRSRELLIEAYKRHKLKDPEMAEAIQLLGDESKLELTPAEEELAKTLGERNAEDQQNSAQHLAEFSAQQKEEKAQTEQAIRDQLQIEAMGLGAERAFSKGRYAAAEQLYRSLLDVKPDHFPALVNLGVILVKRNLVDEAITHLKYATTIDPKSAPATFMLGIAHYRAGHDKEALDALKKTVQIQPDNAMAFLYMGNIEGTTGRPQEAVNYYKKAISINSDMADAHYNLACTLVRMGQLEQARAAYDRAMHAGALPDPELQSILSAGATPQPAAPAAEPQEDDTNPDEPVVTGDKEVPAEVAESNGEAPETPAQTTPSTKPVAKQPSAPVKPATTQPTTAQKAANAVKTAPKPTPTKPSSPVRKNRFRLGA
jgi:Tfp pilus assembly protein PilF